MRDSLSETGKGAYILIESIFYLYLAEERLDLPQKIL